MSASKNALFCALALSATLATAAKAEPVADFYKGKTISLLVASGPGGGYDLYARALARRYPEHVPGKPAIVIQYLPGGGGLVAANNLSELAPRDGTAIGLLASSTLLLAALGDRNTRFENLKLTYVGNMNEEVDTCSVWHATGVKSYKDVMQRDLIIGAAGAGSNSQTFPLAMNKVLGTKFKVITGYNGGAHLRVAAMEKGELQGTCGVFVSTLGARFAKQLSDGQLKVVLQMGLSRHPEFKDVPNALELAKDESGRAALELLFGQLALGRPFFAPPGVPEDRARALAKAFDQTMNDAEFRAEAKKMNVELRWFDAARMKAVMERMEATPEPIKEEVRQLLNVKR